MSVRKELTPDEAMRFVLKQREYQREYQRRPEVREKLREKQREYQRKIRAGYAAAKKAGLI